MITDVPTPDDFRTNGLAFLNLAWEIILDLALGLEESEVEELDDQQRVTDEYWNQAQHPLGVALALTQQGSEFLLKGTIAAVSPFLLVSGEWPLHRDDQDTPFSTLRAIDAQDLIRLHDNLLTPPLTEEFRHEFDRLRRLRNVVMHSLDTQVRFTVQEGIIAILRTVDALIGERRWQALRRQHVASRVNFSVEHGQDDGTDCIIARETAHVFELLGPAEIARFFDFPDQGRRYLCPACNHNCADWQIQTDLAKLRPNEPTSTTVYCVACDVTSPVVRNDCPQQECRGNVISEEYGRCLTCGHRID